MAQTRADQRALHPLAAYNFAVVVNGVSMSFAKITGLQREHKTLTYRHGLSFVEGEQITKFRVDAWVPVTLERGVIPGRAALVEWLERRQPSAMEVSLLDESGRSVVAWRIAKALPVKLTAPAFDASASQLAVESLEIRAAGISIEHRAG